MAVTSMNQAMTLDLVDAYIIAMLGQGFLLAEISKTLGIVPPAATNRFNKVKKIFGKEICEKTKLNTYVLTPTGQHIADACLTFLEQITGGKVRYPTKVVKTNYVY